VRRPAGSARPPQRGPRRKMRLGSLQPRLRYGFAAVCTLLLVITGRLVQLQGLDASHLSSASAAQQNITIELNALRGRIVDRFGNPLAYTSNAQDITVDPANVATAIAQSQSGLSYQSYATQLAPLVHLSRPAVIAVLKRPGRYAVLARALDPVVAEKISELGLNGIYQEATTQREYPGTTTAANIVGTVHSDGTGAAGIEQQFNSVLAGKNGYLTYATDNQGIINPAGNDQRHPAQDGGTVALTIDQNLQYVAQQYLAQAVRSSGAKDAEMAILDAKSGQVLALATDKTFNAADPNTIDPKTPIDAPVMSVFEPGSVQKSITFAAALQERQISPQQVFTVPDNINDGGVVVHDAWSHAPEPYTATGILAQSSNVGTLMIAQKLGPVTWMRYEHLFGVGQATGIELPGESSGSLPEMGTPSWSDSTFANLPFGQGEDMTVLQLASIYQTIANNGVRIPPRIVSTVTRSDGTVVPTVQPAGIRVISPHTAGVLRTMLSSVTQPGGTGKKAAIDGYVVAGKTGTAQQPDPAHGGAYSTWMNWDTFAGMVPADNPQFVVAIMVDNPAHGLEGGDVAAPVFHEIASYELRHAQIPPTGAVPRHVPLIMCKGLNPAFLPANVC
jgi:cell division protein FtsI (penicillin-binding protein 3)